MKRKALSLIAILTAFLLLASVPAFAEESTAALVITDSKETAYASAPEAWKAAYAAASKGKDVTVRLMSDWSGKSGSFGSGTGFAGGRIDLPAKGSVTLDLNGHRIDRNLRSPWDEGSVFRVPSGAIFTIEDSAPKAETVYDGIRGGIITGGWGDDGGGAFDIANATFTMLGGTVLSCSTNGDGGAINCKDADGAVLTLRNVKFISCSTQDSSDECYGGAIYADGDGSKGITLVIEDCVFEDNYSEDDGGALYLTGNVTLTAENSVFAGNRSREHGGAVFTDSDRLLVFRDCVFNDNCSGECGGALYTDEDGGVRLFSCSLVYNEAAEDGGAWYVNDWATFLIDTEIENNKCGGKGGGVYVDSDYDTNLQGLLVIRNNASASSERYADLFLETGAATQARFVNGGLEEGSEVWYGTDGSGGIRVCNEMTGYQLKFFHTHEKKQELGYARKTEEAWSVASVITDADMTVIAAGAAVLVVTVVVLLTTVKKRKRKGTE